MGRKVGTFIKHPMPADYKPRAIGRPRSSDAHAAPWPEYRLKKCSRCGMAKQCREFHRHQTSIDGYQARCKICQIKAVQESRDKQKALLYARQYKAEHRIELTIYERYKYADPAKRDHVNALRRQRRLEKANANAHT